jgi:hypothetical protein
MSARNEARASIPFMLTPGVRVLIERYREGLLAMDSIRPGEDRGARRWNANVHEVQRAQLELRKTPEGRAAITELIDDPVPTVAHWAASHALFWSEGKARAYLESERARQDVGGFEAEMTLREFDAGRLRHDWQPPARR